MQNVTITNQLNTTIKLTFISVVMAKKARTASESIYVHSFKLAYTIVCLFVKVLKSIPWDKVDIEVLTIESNHMGEVFPGSQVNREID